MPCELIGFKRSNGIISAMMAAAMSIGRRRGKGVYRDEWHRRLITRSVGPINAVQSMFR
jgi:hypothetical protein